MKKKIVISVILLLVNGISNIFANDERWVKAGEDKFGVYYVEKQSVKPMMDEQGAYLDVWFKNEHTTAGLEDILIKMGSPTDKDIIRSVYSLNYTISHEKIRVRNWTHIKLKAIVYDKNNVVIDSSDVKDPKWVDFKPQSPIDMVARQALAIVIGRMEEAKKGMANQ